MPKEARGPLKLERGAVIKPRGGRTTVCLAYPNTYYVGMSSLGLQVVYSLINGRTDALAERAFLQDEGPLVSIESGSPVSEFEIVAFSVSYENDYINVAEMFAMSGIPPYSRDRTARDPLVVMGGVCTFFNPEPLADFFDVVLVGEAEELLHEFLDVYESHKLKLDRKALLVKLAQIPGVYVPSLYKPSYNTDGTLKSFEPTEGAPARVTRRYVTDLDKHPAKSVIVTPDTEFSNMYMVELARGCGRHCRFCMAGYVYRPPRVRGVESVLADVREGLKLTDKIGLVGAAVSDYPDMTRLVEEFKDAEVNFTASSLRADSLTPELVALISKGNRTVAIAPEAGSERLRGVINKNITEEQILNAIKALIEGNILNVKLYFMVGLPTETDEDVGAIVELAKKARETQLAAAKKKGRLGTITLSVNCFIPKPWTPMQWAPMKPVESLLTKIRRIEKAMKGVPNMNVIHDVPKWAYLQAAFARGDRRLSDVIVKAAESGGDWKAAFKDVGLDMELYAGRVREKGELFPWDFLDTGIEKDYLWQENDRAGRACHTPPCKVGKCKLCGVC